MNKTQGTEPFNAPVTVEVQAPPAPQPRTLERQGQKTEPYTRRLPQIRGGVCEFCGTLDKNYPAHDQWRICPHFRGIAEIRCSYCDEAVNPEEVVKRARISVAEHPSDRDANGRPTLVVWCDSYKCSGKHEARFRR